MLKIKALPTIRGQGHVKYENHVSYGGTRGERGQVSSIPGVENRPPPTARGAYCDRPRFPVRPWPTSMP